MGMNSDMKKMGRGLAKVKNQGPPKKQEKSGKK